MRVVALAVLLGLGTAALAGPDLVETEWSVAPDGSVRVWPHPENSLGKHLANEKGPLFRSPETGLQELLLGSGDHIMLALLLPGPVDLASLCDRERHFARLGLGLSDEALAERIAAPPESCADAGPLRRRAELDRILAVWLAGERGLAAASPALRAIVEDPGAEPFLHGAAVRVLAHLSGTAAPAGGGERSRAALARTLAEIPAAAPIVLVADQAAVPLGGCLGTFGREYVLAQVRLEMRRLGSAATPRDLVAGQVAAERNGETLYELARLYGNMRIDRSVVALDPAGGPRVWARWEGRFQADLLRRALTRQGIRCGEVEGGFTFELPGAELAFTVSPTCLTLVSGTWPAAPAGKARADELLAAGAGGGGALWGFVRPAPGTGPKVEGLERVTFRTDFTDALRSEIVIEFADEAAAERAGGALGATLPGGLARGADFVRNGSRYTGSSVLPGRSPAEAFLRMLGRVPPPAHGTPERPLPQFGGSPFSWSCAPGVPPEVWERLDLPTCDAAADLEIEERTVEVGVDADGAVWAARRQVDLAKLKMLLFQNAEAKRDLEDSRSPSLVQVLILADGAAPWRAVRGVMLACADPAVRIRALHIAVAAGDLPKTLPVLLPNSGLGRRAAAPEGQRRIVLTLRRGEGEESTRLQVKDAELGTGDRAWARLDLVFEKVFSDPENRDLCAEVVAAGGVPFRDVVRVLGALRRAGVEPGRVTFASGDPPD